MDLLLIQDYYLVLTIHNIVPHIIHQTVFRIDVVYTVVAFRVFLFFFTPYFAQAPPLSKTTHIF